MIINMQMVLPSAVTSEVIKLYKIFVTSFANLLKISSQKSIYVSETVVGL